MKKKEMPINEMVQRSCNKKRRIEWNKAERIEKKTKKSVVPLMEMRQTTTTTTTTTTKTTTTAVDMMNNWNRPKKTRMILPGTYQILINFRMCIKTIRTGKPKHNKANQRHTYSASGSYTTGTQVHSYQVVQLVEPGIHIISYMLWYHHQAAYYTGMYQFSDGGCQLLIWHRLRSVLLFCTDRSYTFISYIRRRGMSEDVSRYGQPWKKSMHGCVLL